MGLYILKSFTKARYLFGLVIDDFRAEQSRLNMDYFFNPRSLVEGNPPMDRNCFSCFKIGHQTKDCPLANARRKEKLQSDSDLKQEDFSNMICFKCQQHGHKAKDCKSDFKRTKTISASMITDKCYNCNQIGHFIRDCPFGKNSKVQIHHTIPVAPHQQSAPAPKMISLMSTKFINSPVVFQSGEKTQMVVNNGSGIASAPIVSNNAEMFFPSNQTSQKAKLPQHHNNIYHQHHQNYQNQQTQIILQRQQSFPVQQYPKNNSVNLF